MIAAILILLAGLASAAAYLWRRQWIDGVLVIVAALALAGLVGNFTRPADKAATVTIDSKDEAPEIGDAATIRLKGDGLRAAQWHDLPARRLEWSPPSGDVLRLDFPRRIALGRMFSLTVPHKGGRLQLVAENGQVIAESTTQTVQWLPPVAETLVLKARVLDAAGKVVAQGPVPLEVRDAAPLQVQGRFGSPSFDARILNSLLTNSRAIVDWQVTLGKTVTRGETARAPMDKPNFLVVDAAYLERLSDTARGALMAQVAGGAPLLVLAASASEPAFWSRTMQLVLKEQPDAKASGAVLAMMSAPYNPGAGASGPWQRAGDRIWARPWEKGRIVWLGVMDWHRYAISEPQALGLWWQDVLDRAGVKRPDGLVWLEPEEMPLPGQRTEICAQGASGDVAFPDLKQTLAWQRRPDKADAACVAVWPQASGWLKILAKQGVGKLYVFAKDDWPLWQKAQRRDATLRYAARTPVPVAAGTSQWPAWPFALVFAIAMLLLWWRERR